jgi:hypothetical protein
MLITFIGCLLILLPFAILCLFIIYVQDLWNGYMPDIDNPNEAWSSDSWASYATVNDELHGIVGYDQIMDMLNSMDNSNRDH